MCLAGVRCSLVVAPPHQKSMVLHYLTLVGDKIPPAELEPLLAELSDPLDLAAFKKLVLGK